jgi:hypothetical protein
LNVTSCPTMPRAFMAKLWEAIFTCSTVARILPVLVSSSVALSSPVVRIHAARRSDPAPASPRAAAPRERPRGAPAQSHRRRLQGVGGSREHRPRLAHLGHPPELRPCDSRLLPLLARSPTASTSSSGSRRVPAVVPSPRPAPQPARAHAPSHDPWASAACSGRGCACAGESRRASPRSSRRL